MRNFKQGVMERGELAGRISQWVEFQPVDLEDSELVATELCEVRVTDDLIERVHKSAGGEIRRIVVGLWRIEQFARKKNLSKVSAADWGDRAFNLGDAPRVAAR